MVASETPPAGTDGAPESLTATKRLNSAASMTDSAPSTRATFDPVGAVADVWVFVVQPEDGRYRRRVFLSAAPAWEMERRARDRGQAAQVVLCRLEPVGGVPR
ncbi:hypothetical protein FBY41_2618 [Humibacillus xanthopallidus]|uniref:Uncharacterized protein n=1 Tax=Humibacillus xanthopallidus TaxID=412689 RepID=A0A543HWC0_9MICO|nr:hypothetical protein FBY41_2618 [Humibacillus xanthopallidus]